MSILVTGFNGKVGFEVANKLKNRKESFKCAVRNVEKARLQYGNDYQFVKLDFSNTDTFSDALEGIDKIFLMYPPGDNIQFEAFINLAKEKSVKHITYLSLKDVQYMPFVHHNKNEKLIKKSGVVYTFLRAGYFMQNLTDFLLKEIQERKRIFVPAGKGKTSFVDTRDIAEIAAISLAKTDLYKNKAYVITGDEALDFYEVADIMSGVLQTKITYTNPSAKEFKEFMNAQGEDEKMTNVVVGVHFPTKIGLAGGIKYDYEKVTGKKPTKLRKYVEDYKEIWQ
ncbi:SDR family oxidoreductase [Bacillus sp. HMF5848]|uniref:SDR family oxidoreductase n=1 Tax=Bacillus sp. HMF5848 TaxID=2495421 RepID=UPI000F77600E|nr:SDR family oxidoreductase [Bacillus sp. HMF5848]RSK25626.1 SDR family oxidoreductase [Bacillus sp. HMF5848]